jgi:hypothetical protein
VPDVLTNPAEFAWMRLNPRNYVVVANLDVAYSLPVCEYYCDQRDIPRDNIVQLRLGTNRYRWVPPNSTVEAVAANLVDPIAYKALSAAWPCSGIILGPGVPCGIEVKTSGPSSTAPAEVIVWASFPGDSVAPPLAEVVANAINFRNSTRFDGLLVVGSSGQYRWRKRFGVGGAFSGSLYRALGEQSSTPFTSDAGAADGAILVERALSAAPGSPSIYVPTSWSTGRFYKEYAVTLPVGRLGWTSWRATGDITESEASVKAIIDRATAAMALTSQPSPITTMISAFDGGQESLPRLVKLIESWGYDSRYFYRDTITSGAEAICPAAGAAWTAASYESAAGTPGKPVDQATVMLLGYSENEEPTTNSAYQNVFLPGAGGGNSTMGLSYGFQYGARFLQRDGCWGITTCSHIGGLSLTFSVVQAAWVLMTGMPAMQAMYFCSEFGEFFTAAGDPLYAPFHWRAGPYRGSTTNETPQPPSNDPGEMVNYGSSGGTFRSREITGHRRNPRR